jgi:Rrf2 family protein
VCNPAGWDPHNTAVRMQFAKATLDQLDILAFVHERGDPCVSVARIAEHLEIPLPFSMKLVSRLTAADLLCAKRGPGGGVMLARPAKSIFLGTTIRQLDRRNSLHSILMDDVAARPSKIFVTKALNSFLELLDEFSLADLSGKGISLKVRTRRRKKTRTVATFRSKGATTALR